MKPTYFVSGHLDITAQEFCTHYVPALRKAVGAGADFVVGDAPGCDSLAQLFLHLLRLVEGQRAFEVTVYHMLERPRHNVGFPTCGGFRTDAERDAALTAASTVDIAWVRPGRESSGTAANLKRRTALGQAVSSPSTQV